MRTVVQVIIPDLGSVGADGRCMCCGDRVTTSGGCLRCASVRTYCCGVIVLCGCGRRSDHRCYGYEVTRPEIPTDGT